MGACHTFIMSFAIFFPENMEVNQMYEAFTDIVLSVTDKRAPMKKKRMHSQACTLYEQSTLACSVQKENAFKQ